MSSGRGLRWVPVKGTWEGGPRQLCHTTVRSGALQTESLGLPPSKVCSLRNPYLVYSSEGNFVGREGWGWSGHGAVVNDTGLRVVSGAGDNSSGRLSKSKMKPALGAQMPGQESLL